MKQSRYAELNNYEWLYNKYIVEKLGSPTIANLVGAKSANSVRQALIRHNIKSRNFRDGTKIKSIDDGFIINDDVITGCLLGDGSLGIFNKHSNFCEPYFYKKNKQYDFVLYVANLLFKDPISKISQDITKYDGSNRIYYKLRSKSTSDLRPYFNKWYPSQRDFKKVVPSDINITPTVLLHWFMDDGSTYRRRKNSNTEQIITTFCTESFSYNDNCLLKQKLEHLGLYFNVVKCNFGTGWRLQLSQSQYKKFIEIIGQCPVKSMEYKWK